MKGKVLGIHQFELKPGITPTQFERFALHEFNPTVKDVFPGVEMTLMKGERGKQVSGYILVYAINSMYVRDYYWPQPGEETTASTAAWEKCGAKCDKVWEKLQEMAERTEYTDYVGLAN